MLDILHERRSIRKYKSTKLDQDTIEVLLKAALLSPSSRGIQPWQFVVVDDAEILTQLAPAKKGSGHLKGAALAIVILADPALSDVWVEDASIAATILHLTAASLGLGSCWIQIRERQFTETETSEQYVRKILGIPENLKVTAIISIGYPDEFKSPHDDSTIKGLDKIHLNQYGYKGQWVNGKEMVFEGGERMSECVFCSLPESENLAENELARAFFDKYPVSKGHVLIITKKHATNIFEATSEEMASISDLLKTVKERLDERFHPDGYNIGANVGAVAGQSVFHFHVHVIPRYLGDAGTVRWHT